MSNSWFQFKEFTVHQDRCAMKVSTDACIQGAWTPVLNDTGRVLDIGTGTGLLSLMLAQRAQHILIDAVELDIAASVQAHENVLASPWHNRVRVVQGDITRFETGKRYELIICNPPFFNHSLLGNNDERNNARHTLSLDHKTLFDVIEKLLTPNGYASVLLPTAEHKLWEEIVSRNGWTIFRKLHVIPNEGSMPNRIVSLCSREHNGTSQSEELVIRSGSEYTEAFKVLMHQFYLK